FDADAHRVASLRHPAIVPIHDHWREPGAAYVVMRRMHGGSLAERLERGPLSAAEVAAIAERIGGALLAAADAGVVHGRVDPAAVLFDNAGAPYLTDFRLGTGPAACAAHADGCDCDAAGFAALLRACRPGGGGVALDALLADPPPI